MATDMVRGNMQKIIAVEVTKSKEVLFALISEILLFKIVLPSPKAWIGMLLLMFRMVLHSYHTS
ncbi:MAG TPA: multidrug resistance efflux transporter family protein [Pseudogracilibacillus sp.]|nr:multidrug resistance efflux transporter family protein [Pseudogracilibacillus sp.]